MQHLFQFIKNKCCVDGIHIQTHYSHNRMQLTQTEVEVEVVVNLRPTVSPPICPGVRRPSGTRDQFFFLLEISFRQLRLCYFVQKKKQQQQEQHNTNH
jgi:hypothetical protein